MYQFKQPICMEMEEFLSIVQQRDDFYNAVSDWDAARWDIQQAERNERKYDTPYPDSLREAHQEALTDAEEKMLMVLNQGL